MNPVLIQAGLKILKAMGVEFDAPMMAMWIETAQREIPAFILRTQAEISSFDARLGRLETRLEQTHSLLEMVCKELGVANSNRA